MEPRLEQFYNFLMIFDLKNTVLWLMILGTLSKVRFLQGKKVYLSFFAIFSTQKQAEKAAFSGLRTKDLSLKLAFISRAVEHKFFLNLQNLDKVLKYFILSDTN